MKYIYQHPNWPHFSWDYRTLAPLLVNVRHLQGKLTGQMSMLGFSLQHDATLITLTMDVLKSSEIEGEKLNYEQVRSSIARRLGLDVAGLVPSARNIEGVVEMMLDATQKYTEPLTDERLYGWQAALFPTGRSGMSKIDVGCYRTNEMQVVSGAMGKEKIHYEAPLPHLMRKEMRQFLEWFNKPSDTDPVLKAALAHFWFVIIHPFDDGNGRIARAISDMQLARSEESSLRFYSLSSQILVERKSYYAVLQRCQSSDGEITPWLVWFLNCLYRALQASEILLAQILKKAEFWKINQEVALNERQRFMLNKLLDGDFAGKLTSSKWAKMNKISGDTALRDIQDLINKEILQKEDAGGRSTNYEFIFG
jgi:Fic family protein